MKYEIDGVEMNARELTEYAIREGLVNRAWAEDCTMREILSILEDEGYEIVFLQPTENEEAL